MVNSFASINIKIDNSIKRRIGLLSNCIISKKEYFVFKYQQSLVFVSIIDLILILQYIRRICYENYLQFYCENVQCMQTVKKQPFVKPGWPALPNALV